MESKLRQAVKQAASEYYRHVHGTKKELTYIPPSGKVLDEEDLLSLVDASLGAVMEVLLHLRLIYLEKHK